jgi:hypothetical protein
LATRLRSATELEAAELLTKVGEDNLAEEAEVLADKIERAEAQARITPREVKIERS